MPALFDDLTDHSRIESVAWLRFVPELDGGGIRAALLETSMDGEPLAFSLSRAEVPVFANPDKRLGVLSGLAKSLLKLATHSPALILALANEIPANAFTNEMRIHIPVCRVDSAELSSGASASNQSRHQFAWVNRRGGRSSQASLLLDRILALEEPFERAARGLDEAFTDQRIRDALSIAGVDAVFSLAPPSASERPGNDYAEGSRAHANGSGSDLAERVGTTLAAPVSSSPNDYFQLEWPNELMPFQQDGVRALLNMDRLLLADDMGLGKTIQAIAAMRILKARREIESCLIVAPASVLDQWRREMTKWAPELSAIIVRGAAADRAWQWATRRDAILVSYDTLRSDFRNRARSPVRDRRWDLVIADEAQRVKNRNPTSSAMKGLRRARSWALTGTPIENSEEELASIMEFIDNDGTDPPKRYRPGAELLDRHRDLQIRRKKSEVLADLPPKLESKLTLNLRPSQRESYRKAEEDGIIYLKSLGAEVSVTHILELIARLKQICNADPRTGESVKLEDIKSRLERLTAQGHKALVFSQYTNDVSGVAAAAKYLREFGPLRLTGDLPQTERTSLIERFKRSDEHKVLILSLRVGGLGLNLQEASYVFHLDRWWNPAVERQAEDRSHRMGQTVKVNVIKYSCADTIEERIDAILERKQRLFDRLIDDVSLDLSARLSREELLGLFGLR